MPIERARQEIDDGIASVKAALGDDTALAPFFRIPGLLREASVEDYLAAQGIQIWSADFPADDWRHISSSRVYELAMRRLEEHGKGILLLHDIQARTVAALPRILQEMKARGYRIVHVVAATPQDPPTASDPQEWQLHPLSETVATSHWPKVPNFAFADAGLLAAPSLSDLDWGEERSTVLAADRSHSRPGRGVPLPPEAPWPRQSPLPLENASITLPVPAQGIFEIQEGLRVAMRTGGPASRHAEPTAVAHETSAVEEADSRRMRRHRGGRGRQMAGHATRHVAHARRGPPLKHLVQVRKRSV
jgi:hypothetical protein